MHVLDGIGPEVSRIYVVDDCCPEGSGALVTARCEDSRVRVLRTHTNVGVGGATKLGYEAALDDGCDVVVKLDSDGQMDPALVPRLIEPILAHRADYVKGNRFFNLEDVAAMPKVRLLGNVALSFVNKACSGYWDIMDPTNGFTAIHVRVLSLMPLAKIADRFFFESDMLFRLSTVEAVVEDMPMTALYAGERSNLVVRNVLLDFPGLYFGRLVKRIGYQYFLRDFNAGSVQGVLGIMSLAFGTAFGIWKWHLSAVTAIAATSGEVMLAALPILLGMQLLISAVNYDIHSVPRIPLHLRLPALNRNSRLDRHKSEAADHCATKVAER